MGEGFPINWAMGMGAGNISTHPLYIKYNSINLGDVVLLELKADIEASPLSFQTQYIQAYLVSLYRSVSLIA